MVQIYSASHLGHRFRVHSRHCLDGGATFTTNDLEIGGQVAHYPVNVAAGAVAAQPRDVGFVGQFLTNGGSVEGFGSHFRQSRLLGISIAVYQGVDVAVYTSSFLSGGLTGDQSGYKVKGVSLLGFVGHFQTQRVGRDRAHAVRYGQTTEELRSGQLTNRFAANAVVSGEIHHWLLEAVIIHGEVVTNHLLESSDVTGLVGGQINFHHFQYSGRSQDTAGGNSVTHDGGINTVRDTAVQNVSHFGRAQTSDRITIHHHAILL